MAKYKIRRSRINHVFISHLHGDHYFGLIGLLTSMGLLGRTQDLHIYAPSVLQAIIELQLKVANIELPYPLHFHPLLSEGVIVSEPKFEVSAFHVFHRIECWGFRFREVRPLRKVNPDNARQHEVPSSFFDRLKKGEDYTNQRGQVVSNALVTDPAPAPRSYAYSSDTLFDERIVGKVRGVDLLYHETTYLKDLEERAGKRFHSTTVQAAMIAKKAGVKRLLIGHFSSKYEKLEPFELEAREVFPNTDLALEGVTYRI
jgi:ribonuclease Z